MPHVTVVIELFENNFEALYSNCELSFVIINRTEDDGETTISGPHAPTLETSRLSEVIDGVNIPLDLLTQRATAPFFASEDTPLRDVS
jgi:hypothetical protein